MPSDITMCPGGQCPQRRQCYRHRSLPVGRQDWFGTLPYDPQTGRCDAFWDIASLVPTEAQIRDRAYALWLASGRVDGRDEEHWFAARAALERAAAEQLTDAPEG